MDAKLEIATIRKVIKTKVPTVSVRNERGTAWGWIRLGGTGEYGTFTETEQNGLRELGIEPGRSNCWLISPDSRAFWLKKLTGVGGGKVCIVCRQPATGSFCCPCDMEHWTCAEHSGKGTACGRIGG